MAAKIPERIAVRDKYTGEVLGEIQADNVESLREKIKVAYSNKDKLRSKSLDERVEFIRKLGRRIRFARNQLTELIAREGGLPIKYANWEVSMIAQGYLHADMRAELYLEERELQAVRGKSYAVYHPLGVCAAMTPRNTPLSLNGWAVGACWLTGNSILIKPSTAVPLTTLKLLEMAEEVNSEFPVESAQPVVTPGAFAVQEFIHNPMIDAILFFGSSHVGKKLLVDYAEYLKTTIKDLSFAGGFMINGKFKMFILEMAGNDAGIITDDVDVEKVADYTVKAAYTNSGQQCFSMKRILVHKDVYDEFVEAMMAKMDDLKMGNPLDPQTDIGPLGSEKILTLIDYMVKDAVEKGGKLLKGGEKEPPFYQPTLIEFEKEKILGAEASQKPFMWVEEAFGPARSIVKYETEEEAIRLANDTNYGMRASIYCHDVQRARRIAQQLETGGIMINTKPSVVDISVLMGGVKDTAYPPGAHDIVPLLVWQQYIHVDNALSE